METQERTDAQTLRICGERCSCYFLDILCRVFLAKLPRSSTTPLPSGHFDKIRHRHILSKDGRPHPIEKSYVFIVSRMPPGNVNNLFVCQRDLHPRMNSAR